MKQILIVEDDKSLLQVLYDKLTQEGYSILSAVNGAIGLEAAQKNHPDLILLDIVLPKMDGMAMMHKLREDEWGKKVPVIILTNYDATDKRLTEIVSDQPAYYLIKADN